MEERTITHGKINSIGDGQFAARNRSSFRQELGENGRIRACDSFNSPQGSSRLPQLRAHALTAIICLTCLDQYRHGIGATAPSITAKTLSSALTPIFRTKKSSESAATHLHLHLRPPTSTTFTSCGITCYDRIARRRISRRMPLVPYATRPGILSGDRRQHQSPAKRRRHCAFFTTLAAIARLIASRSRWARNGRSRRITVNDWLANAPRYTAVSRASDRLYSVFNKTHFNGQYKDGTVPDDGNSEASKYDNFTEGYAGTGRIPQRRIGVFWLTCTISPRQRFANFKTGNYNPAKIHLKDGGSPTWPRLHRELPFAIFTSGMELWQLQL